MFSYWILSMELENKKNIFLTFNCPPVLNLLDFDGQAISIIFPYFLKFNFQTWFPAQRSVEFSCLVDQTLDPNLELI